MTTITDFDMLMRVVPDDPMTYSREGLDDDCYFCAAEYRRLSYPVPAVTFARAVEGGRELRAEVQLHEDDCVWIAAADHLNLDRSVPLLSLGADQPDPHYTGKVGHLTRTEYAEWKV